MSLRNLELFRFPFYVNYNGICNLLLGLQNTERIPLLKNLLRTRSYSINMNGEYEMCACGHFRKDHDYEIGVTKSNCRCGCPEFRKRN